MASSINTVQSESAHTNLACEFIRHRILNGAYPPGYRLKTIKLAKESKVSRTPVREALRQLQTEGLVDIKPRLGACVRAISLSEYKEMCDVRLALEAFSAELAATNRSPTNLVEIEEAFGQMEKLVKQMETAEDAEELGRELAKSDIRFHLAILDAAGNGLLRKEVLRLHLLNNLVNINIFRMHGLMDDSASGDSTGTGERRRMVLECHRSILLAVQTRDAEAAHRAMRDHLKEIIERWVVAMARSEKRSELADDAGAEIFQASL